jgi:hypothetical protein
MIGAARRRAGMSTATTALVLSLAVIVPIGVLAWKGSRVPAITTSPPTRSIRRRSRPCCVCARAR